MTEEVPTSVLELILNQSNYLIKLQNNFIDLQTKFLEEKEKNFNLEKKILENELKEMKEKIQKLESDHKNEIEELKQNSKQAIIFQTEIENDICLNKVNDQKDEKINSLEKEINKLEKANYLFEQKFADLTIKFEQLNNVTCKVVNFIEIKNTWKYISEKYSKCCENKCINTDKPVGNCIKGNGYVNLISDEYIRYYNCVEGKGNDIDVYVHVHAKNSFERPQNCFNYSLFYFEVKSKMERELNNCLNWMVIGVIYNESARFIAKCGLIKDEKNEEFKLSTFSWNDNDIFGCGLVYPPTMVNEFPYIFFTQNGKQIGKALLLKNNSDRYQPYVVLRCCSVETNFGNNLETKPFIYDISKHFVCKEFY
uniref:SPRY domain-containing protein n=1 Tax=Meloidogyne incognita TaxID=6306 RepID=A0A914NHE5_MELIC